MSRIHRRCVVGMLTARPLEVCGREFLIRIVTTGVFFLSNNVQLFGLRAKCVGN